MTVPLTPEPLLPSVLSPGFLAVLGSLSKLVILALLLERALVMVFDYRWYKKYLDNKGLSAPIAYAVSLLVYWSCRLDVLSDPFEPGKPTAMGIAITSSVVAGGSAGAITLFQGVLGLSKEAQTAQRGAKIEKAKAETEKARAEIEEAKAGRTRSFAVQEPAQALK